MAGVRKSNILLDSGTNELEVLEFTIANQHFGINVSKVNSIMQTSEVTPMPNASPFVEGIFKPREEIGILTLINLGAYMGLPESDFPDRDIYIITNFNNNYSAFHVHTVEAIHRITWERIEKPDPTIYGGADGLATGIARIGGRLVTIIDFEKILLEIGLKSGLGTEEPYNGENRPRYSRPIMVVEDSTVLERLLNEFLQKAGFTNIIECSNGKEAWDIIASFKDSGLPVTDHISLLITDIEMPKMDGHRLTKLIKDDEYLREIPVIIFSSLINNDMRHKGEQVGANAQISKADLHKLLPTIDLLIY
ncbi:MAG: chemotaxis protein [Defluviitaleaceae bacterium]|nr:chemotaxis protein [Defluviitaleaceae bacterium]MCL2835879.1 chemotaxis protein [Defluviitaleaceae bacterium]